MFSSDLEGQFSLRSRFALLLVALGYGLGQFVPAIDGVEYARFVAPAVVATGS